MKPDKSSVFNYLNVDPTLKSFLSSEEMPTQLKRGGLFVCLQGEATVTIDMRTYTIKRGDLCVSFPNSILQTLRRSDHFEGFALGVNVDYIRNIQMPSTSSYYLNIKDNPCISLTENEQTNLLALCRELIDKEQRAEHPFREAITDHLLMVICYEIVAIYLLRKPIVQEARTRHDLLFQRFIFSVMQNCKVEREVEFYAQQLCITTRYLSSIVKEKSGRSGSQWIAQATLLQAKSLLTNKERNIQQIAEELHFPNPSFFTQYFKKHTGMTPKQFRAKE